MRPALCHPDQPERAKGLCAKCYWRQASRKTHLRREYGLSLERYQEMFQQQKGMCAICGQPASEGRMLDVDHNHQTGTVRGLLCNLCNQGLGQFRDDPQRLRNALQYLAKHQEN